MQNDYLITQKPLKALIFFSLPMIIGNLFQQAYTMADSAIVGRLVGENALAAVWGCLFSDQYFYLYCHWWGNRRFCYRQSVFWTGELWKIKKGNLYSVTFFSCYQYTSWWLWPYVQ